MCEIENENVKEESSLVSESSRKSYLKEILYPYLRSDGSDKRKKSSITSHVFVEWGNLSQLTHLHWAMMDSK